MNEVTEMLAATEQGKPHAAEELLPLVYAELRAHTDRRPMHLYAQLEAPGFTGESQEQSDGSFITHIRRC